MRPLIRRFVFLFLIVLIPTGIVYSAGGVADVTITEVDSSEFPLITVFAKAVDDAGIPVQDLQPEDMTLQEGNTPVTGFELDEVDLGNRVSIVIDAGAGINALGGTSESRLEEIKTVISDYVQRMDENDFVEIIAVQPPNQITVIQDFTNEKSSITSSVNAFNVETGENLTFGLEGISRALDDLVGSSSQTGYQAVLFLSTGIQDQGRLHLTPGELYAKAKNVSIPVHTILFRHSDLINHSLDDIARETGGEYAYYTRALVETPVLDKIFAQGFQYKISYRSSNPAESRVITLTVLPSVDGPALDDFRLVLDPAPGAPEVFSVTVNNNDPLIREADERAGADIYWPTEVEVEFQIEWPDGYGERAIEWAELVVDGEIIGSRLTNVPPGGTISMPWDLRTYSRAGETSHNVQVHFVDELGFEVLSPDNNVALTVRSALCGQFQGTEQITCYLGSVVAPALGIVSFVLIIAAIAYYFLRPEQFRARLGSVQSSVQKFADEVTQTLRIRGRGASGQMPMAYLHLVKGTVGMRNRYPLYQRVTQIGRDDPGLKVEDGDIAVSDKAISRPHVNIAVHGDEYTITDRGSANGTWLNGNELEAEEEQALKEGDLIEIAEYEPGERLISFTFSLYGETPDSPYPAEDDKTIPQRKKKSQE